jgi:3-carboxy-cis,cis-muconate cycloisomerase
MNSDNPITSLFSTAEIDRIFSVRRQLQCMTEFERALTTALESVDLTSKESSAAFDSLRDAAFIDTASLMREAHQSGNVAIPFIRQLTAAISLRNPEAALNIHLGATSQDLMDTALVLQMREAFEVFYRDLHKLDQTLVGLVREQAQTLLVGRTWLQDGPPVTLGLKLAGWLAALRRHKQRLFQSGQRGLVLQFGGAVGTLAALGEHGPAVSAVLAKQLSLREPDLPWHTHRDSLVEIAGNLALLVGTLGKIARDVSLLMQTEVAEVFEPRAQGRGGSSTMPHKRNPVASAVILAAAARTPGLLATLLSAMVQEHERGLGGWHAEWETLPEIFRLAAVALSRTLEIAEGLEIDPERMRENLNATGGLVLSEAVAVSLAKHTGRVKAHALLQEASQRVLHDHLPLRDVLLAMPEVSEHLNESELTSLLDPRNYIGSTQHFIDRVLRESPNRAEDALR